MKKLLFILVGLIIFGLLSFSDDSKSKATSSKNNFGIEHFKQEMKSRDYKFEIKDLKQDFLPTIRKRMMIGNEALDIYLYSNNKNMETESEFIDRDGSGYNNGSKSINISWVSTPHFFKRGSIIVQYIGTNKKVISDLKDILGDQFAGGK